MVIGQMPESDYQLVYKVVSQKDTHAFGKIMKRYQSPVRNFLRKLTGNFALADDLSQDCFLQAWDKMHSFSGKGSFLGWLMKIAYTTFLQYNRKSTRYNEIMDLFGKHQATQQEASNDLIENQSDLDMYLSVLKEQDRAIMVLSYSYGLSHSEISGVINLPVGTIKSIIFRARQTIREQFDFQQIKRKSNDK